MIISQLMEENHWIAYIAPDEWETRAKTIREKRDALYGNIFPEEDTDLRWVGDLGEICFNHWLKENGITGFRWHLDTAAGQPDFTVNDLKIDVKTVKRKVPPSYSYTAQITARHETHPIDELFFISYEYQYRKLWLLGGIGLQQFLRHARYYSAGEAVHENYVIREGHEIYNAEISILTSPEEWLEKLRTV